MSRPFLLGTTSCSDLGCPKSCKYKADSDSAMHIRVFDGLRVCELVFLPAYDSGKGSIFLDFSLRSFGNLLPFCLLSKERSKEGREGREGKEGKGRKGRKGGKGMNDGRRQDYW